MHALFIAAILSANTALALGAGIESQPTVAGVAAVESHWSDAFIHGDSTYLRALLAPDYISVNAAGVPRDRDRIISLAETFAKQSSSSPMPPQPPLDIHLQGTTAIATSTAGGQRSVDVFYYADGAWHAWYSQHTTIKQSP